MMQSKKKLGIYIHIPFCVRKCLYCDFLSFPSDEKTKEKYIQALIAEIEQNIDIPGFNKEEYIVDSVFIGGGTPSCIKPIYINKILCKLKEIFHIDNQAEITMECNPGTASKEAFELYYKSGINRISFGLQSCNDEELKCLGRIHNYETFLESFHWAREAGFKNINIDLISAIPEQTLESFMKSLKQVILLGPDHISAYSLIVEEGTPFYEMDLNLPDEDTEREIYEETGRILRENGYEQYEISNYAKNGYECRHNIKYWTREEYLAFGLGASSFIKVNDLKDKKELRWRNSSDIEMFNKKIFIREEMEELELRDSMSEYLFLGLRMNRGISESEFGRTFHLKLEDVFGDAIKKHTENGLLSYKEGVLKLTDLGRNLSNYVFSDFLL